MANWSGIILTDRGRALQAKVETGVSLNITKFKLGDGIASGALESLLDLVHPLQTVGIGSVKALGGMCEITENNLEATVKLSAVIDSRKDIEVPFFFFFLFLK